MAGNDGVVATIEELIANGTILAHKDGNYGSNYPRVEEFGSEGVPFLTAKSLRDGYVDIAGAPRLGNERADSLTFGFVQQDDVLLSHNATVGRVAIVPPHNGRLLVGTSLTYFRLDQGRLLSRYLAVYFTGREFQNQLAAVMSHSTRNQVPVTAQRKLSVVVPTLTEQKAIASVLGTLDDLIELNRETNEILEEMARALFKSWFVDFDPVRAKLEGRPPAGMDAETAALFPDHFEDSELGQIPRGWRAGAISDLAAIRNQSVNPGSKPERVWEHYSIPAFDAGAWPASDKGSEIKSGKYRIPESAVLLSKLNPDTPRVWLPDLTSLEAAICSTEFLPFVPQESEHRSFVFELLRSEPVFSEICNRATGSTGSRQRVKPRDVERIRTVIPPDEVIRAFVSLAGPHHEMIATNRRESRDLAALRDTLLPKLLSGELPVSELDAVAAAG